MWIWMYNVRDSQTTRHKITLDGLTCRYNQSIQLKVTGVETVTNIISELGLKFSWGFSLHTDAL